MVKYYLSQDAGLEQLSSPSPGCWVSMINPSEAEVLNVSEELEIDPDALRAALDDFERSRIETDEDYTMILVNIPIIETQNDKELYNTIPLSIILVKDVVITVCSVDTPVLHPFANGRVRDFRTFMKSRFIFQILHRNATLFLHYLTIIDRKSEEVENKLHKSTRNNELIELLKLEKSLVYFTTALRSNEVVLEKLLRYDFIKKYADDADLLEDVIVENKQAIEMASIYSGILTGTMDAFASVISNNLNIVMKVLAIITVVMAIPEMIFSAFGMNLSFAAMPFTQRPWAFGAIVLFAAVISIIVFLIFRKAKLFK